MNSDKSRIRLGNLGGRIGYRLWSGTPDIGGENRAGFGAVASGYYDADRLVVFGDFTYLLHSILMEFRPEVITGARL